MIIDKINYVSKIKIILTEEIDFAKNVGLENVLLSTNKHGLTMLWKCLERLKVCFRKQGIKTVETSSGIIYQLDSYLYPIFYTVNPLPTN